MEEFVDCTVIEIGKLIFEYMQSRSARLVEGFNPAKGKGPILLRTTNELKRRLSRETDAAFIGRIMIFISLLLPPWERSGVNLRGNYNVESITKYEELEQDENKMDVDGDEDSTGIGGLLAKADSRFILCEILVVATVSQESGHTAFATSLGRIQAQTRFRNKQILRHRKGTLKVTGSNSEQ